jgi:L-threonylcarbamoyladenylate synthase
MGTRHLYADRPEDLAQAAAILDGGGLVAFGTETVYGLGADAFNARAVARVFAAKQRPSFDPLIVHLAEAGQLSRVAEDPRGLARRLAPRFWPGPLTLVLPKLPVVPDLVSAGLPTVGVRVPQSPAARALLAACKNPIAAPSANLFGRVSPTTAQHVLEQLDGRIEAVLDAGPCAVGLESSILSLVEEPPALLRPGAVTLEMLAQALGPVALADGPQARPQAPGQLPRHYAPRTPLSLVEPDPGFAPPAGERAGLLCLVPPVAPQRFAAVALLAVDGGLEEAAANLFACLRSLDELKLDRIYAQAVPEQGLGRAIMNRLKRAAAA